MSAAEIITEIEQADGKIWMDGDRLKFRDTPARLIPAIREHKAALLALLKNETGIAPTMQHSADMAPQSPPATVSCGQCVRFQPGTMSLGIGTCLATDGMDASPLHRTGSGEFQKGVLA
ncbi:hypothetical protein [Acidithiobacillus sp.]